MKEFHRDFANRTGLAQAWTVKSADRLFTKLKSLKTESLGALLEVEVGKICTTPARNNDLEVKIVKN